MEADKQEILNLMAEWRKCLEDRDLDRMFTRYAPHVVLFDCKPPHVVVGKEAVRKCWEECLPYFPNRFSSEHAQVEITVDGNMALMHCFHRFLAVEDEEKWKECFHWLRISVTYQKIDGNWLVIHEHVSMPFDPMTGNIVKFDI